MSQNKPIKMRLIREEADENLWDESTFLDNSTVPTYEEFTVKSKTPLKKNTNAIQRYMNSTEASCILTDDESIEEETAKVDDPIGEITNSINSLTMKSRIFGANMINSKNSPFKETLPYSNRNETPTLLRTKQYFPSPSSTLLRTITLKNTPTKPKEPVTPTYSVTPSFKDTPCRINASNNQKSTVTTSNTNKINQILLDESNDYVIYSNKITQTSFVFQEESFHSKRSSGSVIFLNDSIEDEFVDEEKKEEEKPQIIVNNSSDEYFSPKLNGSNIYKELAHVTQRKKRYSIVKVNDKKRVSLMCGENMNKETIRIDDTILDESENESDIKKGRILYVSAVEEPDDYEINNQKHQGIK